MCTLVVFLMSLWSCCLLFKRKTAYEMRISDWSSDVCSSDLNGYFARMMDYYGGSYPLAVAAYNAGPGNVNKWLRACGQRRQEQIGRASCRERVCQYV